MILKRKIAAILAIMMGLLVITGAGSGMISRAAAEDAAATELTPPMDFTLTDQYGEEHTLSEYKGKVVFLNLWATWCPYCIMEMPDIEALYHEMGENEGKVVFLGLASPKNDKTDEAGIYAFMKEKGFTYPCLMDREGTVFRSYVSTGLPTTWLILPDGKPMGYVPGMMEKDQMLELINQAMQEEQDGATDPAQL